MTKLNNFIVYIINEFLNIKGNMMYQMNENAEHLKKVEDHFMTIFALSSLNDDENDSSCPSANLLTAYFEGHLKGQDYDRIKAHINHCSKCANISLAVYSCVQSRLLWKLSHFLRIHIGLKISKNQIQYGVMRIGDQYENIKRFISRPDPFHVFQLALVHKNRMYLIPVCMILLICLFFLWPDHTLEDRLQKSYLMVKQELHINRNITLPWKRPENRYGFIGTSHFTPAHIAFGAGLWKGHKELPVVIPPSKTYLLSDGLAVSSENNPEWLAMKWKGKKWRDTPWKSYFLLGKWSILQQYVCLSDSSIDQDFWKNQIVVLHLLLKNIQHYNDPDQDDINTIIIKSLDKVKQLLSSIDINRPEEKYTKQISENLLNLNQYLCPKK